MAMRVELTGRHMVVTPELRQIVEQHLGKLDRVLNDSAVSTQVVLSREKRRCLAEVTVHARTDHMLHGVGDATTWPASLKRAVDKVSHQARTLKGKWTSRHRRATGVTRQPVARFSESPRPRRGVPNEW